MEKVRLRDVWLPVLETLGGFTSENDEVLTSPVRWMLWMDKEIAAVVVMRSRWLLERDRSETEDLLRGDILALVAESICAIRALEPEKSVRKIVEEAAMFAGNYPGPMRIVAGGHPETGLFTGLLDASTLVQRAVMLRSRGDLVEALYRLLEMLSEAYTLTVCGLVTGDMEPVGEEPPYWMMEKDWNLGEGWK